MMREPVEVALAGGLLKAGAAIIDPLNHALGRRAPLAALVSPRWPPILGAVIMALEQSGIQWRPGDIGIPVEVGTWGSQ